MKLEPLFDIFQCRFQQAVKICGMISSTQKRISCEFSWRASPLFLNTMRTTIYNVIVVCEFLQLINSLLNWRSFPMGFDSLGSCLCVGLYFPTRKLCHLITSLGNKGKKRTSVVTVLMANALRSLGFNWRSPCSNGKHFH